jgi:hypothetical protein
VKHLYRYEQQYTPEAYNAFIRRIHKIAQYFKDGSRHEYNTEKYMSGNMIETDPAEEKVNPFEEDTKTTAKGEQLKFPEEPVILECNGDFPF